MTEHASSEPTQRQMRLWLRQNHPNLGVGTRGFLSEDAIRIYREAHDLPVEVFAASA